MQIAETKPTPYDGNYQGCIIFEKGDLRGVFALYSDCFAWDVFSDPDYTQHLNWNAPECRIFDGNNTNIAFFEAVKKIFETGFTQRSVYFQETEKQVKPTDKQHELWN
ncbi:MAG: hypothetical protein LBK94_07250 [Prevotellaceae bacterium]|nr:hypothetical protein [Prevotellaceae bacterium]